MVPLGISRNIHLCLAHCHKVGLPLTSIRPTSFHTNFLTYDAESLRKENCFRSPLGYQAKVNWVHCRDIGEVAAALLLKKETPGTGVSIISKNLVFYKD